MKKALLIVAAAVFFAASVPAVFAADDTNIDIIGTICRNGVG